LRADQVLCKRLGEAGRHRAQQGFRWSDRWDKLSEML
jgi:hypothetical protein